MSSSNCNKSIHIFIRLFSFLIIVETSILFWSTSASMMYWKRITFAIFSIYCQKFEIASWSFEINVLSILFNKSSLTSSTFLIAKSFWINLNFMLIICMCCYLIIRRWKLWTWKIKCTKLTSTTIIESHFAFAKNLKCSKYHTIMC